MEEKGIYIKRKDFSKIKAFADIPDLVEVQKKSYSQFLQMELLPHERKDVGLQAAFKSIFPVSDQKGNIKIFFDSYRIGEWSCSCGRLKGVENARPVCKNCGSLLPPDTQVDEHTVCPVCGAVGQVEYPVCSHCGGRVKLQIMHSPEECKEKGYTYSAPLYVKFKLALYEKGKDRKEKRITEIKEGEVYFGEIPLMTSNGTFIINGTERVIVSQLQRSSGVYFVEKKKERGIITAEIVPDRGERVEIKYDPKGILYSVISKKKIPVTTFLRALGLEKTSDIIKTFYTVYQLAYRNGKLLWKTSQNLVGKKLGEDLYDKDGELIGPKGATLSSAMIERAEKHGIDYLPISSEELDGAFLASDVELPEMEGKKGIIPANTPMDETHFTILSKLGKEFEVFFPYKDELDHLISTTLSKDRAFDRLSAYIEIFRRLRPGEKPTKESARAYFRSLFLDPQRFHFQRVGKYKVNIRLGLNSPLDDPLLRLEDYIAIVKYLLRLRLKKGRWDANFYLDDIDSLANRRVRPVGEQVENAFRMGLRRMERTLVDKLTTHPDPHQMTPADVVTPRPAMAVLMDYFTTSQLSQFMDQTNPLSEITHKRRLSALGPGGLKRKTSGFEVRDVHPSHYGRICPIETPEGQNIGLIVSLTTYARVNEYGFIETPYRKVENGRIINYYEITYPGDSQFKVGDRVKEDDLIPIVNKLKAEGKQPPRFKPYLFYLTVWEERKYNIAQANVRTDEKGYLLDEYVSGRKAEEFKLIKREEVDFVDLAPVQVVSVAASLIPFLEHDDANRALMGSNMQRQAVPLIKPEPPIVGTGMEAVVARDSGAVITAKRSGVVEYVDAERIIIRVTGDEVGKQDIGADLYTLTKYKRSNSKTTINQKPIVKKGQFVKAGQVIADGPATNRGELALGRNVLVAFMPWRGYNYEDAIVISERLVKEDAYTSIHIEEFTVEAREVALGEEEFTREIPEVPESKLRHLDESGIVRIGTKVKPGDILVGKIAPKEEVQLTPEEKLIIAIFGEKALDKKDESLRCPPGVEGTVIDVKVFTRRGRVKDARAKALEEEEIAKLRKHLEEEIRIIQMEKERRIKELLRGEVIQGNLLDAATGKVLLKKGTKLEGEVLDKLPYYYLKKLKLKPNPQRDALIQEIEEKAERQIIGLKQALEEKIKKIRAGEDLPPGVRKVAKVYIASKRKIQVGDKMSGRHGNKGVVSIILPEEDMPFLPDGTPVDVVLNPLGVPSRMNVGQILETHLGWAAKALGLYVSTPVFNGATEEEVKEMLRRAGLPEDGKIRLRDGRTGEEFMEEATVGYMYMMKLVHMVDDKIHARSTGPYALVTRQPLGGKARFGGQRLGEMEVWALEAYGAAFALHEMLTAKSDDVKGREKLYEGIINGTLNFTPGLPSSVNVIVRELQALGIDVDLLSLRKRRRRRKLDIKI